MSDLNKSYLCKLFNNSILPEQDKDKYTNTFNNYHSDMSKLITENFKLKTDNNLTLLSNITCFIKDILY